MASFRYTAIGPSGERQHGVMEADTVAEVVARLQGLGCAPLRAEPSAGAGAGSAEWLRFGLGGGRGLRRQEVADIILELATMLGAGQDLDRALRHVQEAAPNLRVRRVAGALREAVRDGSALSTALARQPGSFSPLHVGLVRAGEAAGTLAPALAQLAELLDRQRSLAASVTSALVYPALLLAATVGSVALLLTLVLPEFVPLFEQSGAALPASTRFLIDASDAASRYGAFAPLALAAVLLAGRAVLRRPGPRLAADRGLLRLPVVGPLLREVAAARFARVLGTLLVNGVALIPALGVARDTLGNRAAAAAVDRAAASARGGGGLAEPLAASGVFPPRTIQLLRLGEENAKLGPIALRAAGMHEERTRLALQRLLALLVPAITVVMGALVAGIVMSMMSAMLGLNDLATR